MGPDAARIISSVAKSIDIDRSPSATQRASEIAQDQLASESVAVVNRKRTDAAGRLQQARMRLEREKRRRELERKMGKSQQSDQPASEDSGFDMVA